MAKRWIDHVFDSTLGLQEFCANIKPCDIIIINKIWYTVILYCIKWSKILSLIKTYCFLSICIYECIYIYIIHCIVYTPSHSHQPQWHPHGVPQSSQMEIWKSPKISGSSFFLTRGHSQIQTHHFLGFTETVPCEGQELLPTWGAPIMTDETIIRFPAAQASTWFHQQD